MNDPDPLNRLFGIMFFVSTVLLITSIIVIIARWTWNRFLKKRYDAFLESGTAVQARSPRPINPRRKAVAAQGNGKGKIRKTGVNG